MAIQTIKATIQMRYGLEADLKPDQLVTGEWAVSTDTKKIWMCFRPGLVLRMATYEAFEQDMREIQLILATCQNIQAAVERFMQLAEQHASQAETWSATSKSWAVGGTGTREGEDTDNSKYYSEQSKNEADRAKEEADRAAAIAGIDIDSELSETSANPVQNKVITAALKDIDISDKLETVAFSGSYNDLLNKPQSLKNPKSLTFTGAVTGNYDGSVAKTVAVPSGTNNLTATVSGTWLDAVQGKNLSDRINKIRIKKIATLNGGTTEKKEVTIKTIKNAVLILFSYRYLGAYAVGRSVCIPRRVFTQDVIVYESSNGSGSAIVTYVSDTKVKYEIPDANWKIDIDALFFS